MMIMKGCVQQNLIYGWKDFCLQQELKPGPEVIKNFFMLNSVEHEILNAHKYKNIKKSAYFRLR